MPRTIGAQPRPLYYEEFVALFGFATRDPWPRFTLERAAAEIGYQTWAQYVADREAERFEVDSW